MLCQAASASSIDLAHRADLVTLPIILCRTLPGLQTRLPDDEAALDPDNTPPRSRLFMVVPKNSDGSIIEAEMSRFAGMQYCKTDLIASKGIVFVKYATSSSACMAMEAVQVSGTVAGYKVKIMLAEPKTRRNDMVGGAQFLPGLQAPRMGGAPGHVAGGFPGGSMASQLLPPISASLLAPGMDFSTIQSAVGNIAAAFPQGIPNLGGHGAPQLDVTQLRGQQGLGGSGFAGLGVPGLGNDMSYMGLGAFSNLSLAPQMLGSGSDLLQPQQQLQELDTFQQMPVPQGAGGNTRLFIVVHKGVGEEDLAPIFQCFPGMEYLDLKRDRMTGRSKGYAYVNYATPGAAAAAQAQLNGIEYPQGSGCRLKVLFAEPLSMSRSRSDDSAGHPLDAAAAARAALLANPSQDAINSFRLPSPPSGDSVAQLGSLGTGHQQQQQHSARTDMSSASHDSIISPNSSPLRMNSDAGMQGQLDAQHIELGSVQNGLSTLSLGLSLGNTAANNSNNSHGAVGNAFHTSPHSTSRGSGGHSDSGDGAGSWRESSPDNHSATSNGGAKSLPSPGDPTVVYSALHRPLPDYALSHVFQQCGSGKNIRKAARPSLPFALVVSIAIVTFSLWTVPDVPFIFLNASCS